jgi:hypothetical protein
MTGLVIQATGRLDFEDGSRSGDFVLRYSYHMSVCIGWPDQMKQSNLSTASTWMGDRLMGLCPLQGKLICCWPGVVSHCEAMIQKHAFDPLSASVVLNKKSANFPAKS